MKPRKIPLLISALLTASVAIADDSQILRKSMSKSPGQTAPAGTEAEHAFINMMKFYVPAQASNGTATNIEYINIDGIQVDDRVYAKPLVGVYIYGQVKGVEGVGFVGHGKRDAFAAVSLDDGNTWKRTNLSESADTSSSDVVRDDIEIFADTAGSYPGDVINIFHATAGNKAIAVWPSRYCRAGSPNYSLEPDNPGKQLIASYMGINLDTPSHDDLYLLDMFGVSGHQGSVDYSEDEFEQNHEVGEVPYACLWASRGTLELNTEGTYDMVWRKAERLTSGARDVNRVEVKMVAGAGAAITWQEDPEGLRPGQGEGPGEGWSGAIANSQTDVWYAFLPWEYFDQVEGTDSEGNTAIMSLADYNTSQEKPSNRPKAGIPISMPMRITDNAKCNVTNPKPYCNGSAISDNHTDVLNPLDYSMRDMCADTIQVPTGPQGTPADVCVTEDGLPLIGNVASTRPRLGLFGYNSSPGQGQSDDGYDSAWAVIQAEESKGLGKFFFTDEGVPCEEGEEDCNVSDDGKNMWYYSFSMSLFDNRALEANGFVAALGGHGNMLNQPEINWTTGAFYPLMNTANMWDFGGYNFDMYRTEIARRGSLLAQDAAKVDRRSGSKAKSGLVAMPAWKQGIMNQGGPADVMVRRIVLPRNYQSWRDNPYDFRNMECSNWAFQSGANPYYPDGLCLDPAINLSSVVPDICVSSEDGSDVDCPVVIGGVTTTNPVLQGNDVTPNKTKVLTWHQCPSAFTTVSGETVTCENGDNNFTDQSWYNPLDVAKGHRGFLDGDFVMLLYAWSPNWRLNTVGHDRYELYVRRSFDGGETWTTLPSSFRHLDNVRYTGNGNVTCETYRSEQTQASGNLDEPHVCNQYAAGAAEQARNVSQLKSMSFTILDPRYAPTSGTISDVYGVEDEDTRDPSRYFIVYETGDNTTAADGEPEPLDLNYSRAVHFGDNYQVWAEEDDLSVCYPNDPHDYDVPEELIGSGFCNEFDDLEGKQGVESSEASLTANPGGEFLYGVWSQIEHETGESDAMARRVWYIDDWYSETEAWPSGSGSSSGAAAVEDYNKTPAVKGGKKK